MNAVVTALECKPFKRMKSSVGECAIAALLIAVIGSLLITKSVDPTSGLVILSGIAGHFFGRVQGKDDGDK